MPLTVSLCQAYRSMSRLVHVSAEDPGYRRKGRGKGFEYLDTSGNKVSDPEELRRFKNLRIPPAWKNVWISLKPNGHLQATGIDARGRKQYLYHVDWITRSSTSKFDRMAGFAKMLPNIRKRVQLDLRKQGWPREKVISLVISILDQTSLRIGNKMYEVENGTFGLTTLKRKHLKVNGDSISFQFKAKSGIYQQALIKGKRLTRLIRECSELPGQEVFQYLDAEGQPHPVYSHDVNHYLQKISGTEITAKDFRTWGGSVWALELLPDAIAELQSSPKKSPVNCLVKRVAEKLGNTIAVCKSYYIHPAMLELAGYQTFDPDQLHAMASKEYPDLTESLGQPELIALFLIENPIVIKEVASVGS